MIVKSKRIYTDTGLKNGYLIIENGKFKGISETVDGDYIDYCDQRIIPGIFDTHNHGTLGYSLMGTGDDFLNEVHVRGYLKGCASQGITSVLPTTTSTDGMISTVVKISRENPIGAKIVGIHSEGPWLNRVGEKGIPTPWPEVSLDTAKKMVTDGEGMLRLVALAPEIDGIDPIIDYFRSEGITLAFAHSDCNYKEAMNAYNQKGLSVATHTGNVMTGMHHRDIGGLGASLVNDKVECELICDGMHISLEMIDIFFRIKDYSRFMMISDCTPFSGAPVGHYSKGFHGMSLNVTPEGFVLSDTGRLCGSSQPVLFGIGNLVEKLNIPISTVLEMSSLNPCRKYGIDKEKGSISIGKDADFVVISDDYKAVATYVEGNKVYDQQTDKNLFNPDFYKPDKQSS